MRFSSTNKFQSLFFWNFVWEAIVLAPKLERKLFQSLFFWNFVWELPGHRSCRRSIHVSILVFLEFRLGDLDREIVDEALTLVSILVFLEFRLGVYHSETNHFKTQVSILVFLEFRLGALVDDAILRH